MRHGEKPSFRFSKNMVYDPNQSNFARITL
jgi:hypothetical protein